MKRMISLTLALVLALTLAGCAKPETGSLAPETTAAEKPLSLGRIDGGTYTNAYAGFGVKLDENWTFYSAEELQEMPAAVWEAMEGSELEKQMGDVEQLMDMKADNPNDMTTMNVVYSKMDMSTRVTMALLSEEEIIDANLTQQEQMQEAYAQMGIAEAQMEKVQVKFLGEDHWAMKTTAKVQGMDYYVLQIMNFRAGAYGVTLSCASFEEDNTQTLLDLFYGVGE